MFYYDEGYPMHVPDAAKRLIQARDAYLEAWVIWNDTCLGAGTSIEDEADTITGILRTNLEKQRDDRETNGGEHP